MQTTALLKLNATTTTQVEGKRPTKLIKFVICDTNVHKMPASEKKTKKINDQRIPHVLKLLAKQKSEGVTQHRS